MTDIQRPSSVTDDKTLPSTVKLSVPVKSDASKAEADVDAKTSKIDDVPDGKSADDLKNVDSNNKLEEINDNYKAMDASVSEIKEKYEEKAKEGNIGNVENKRRISIIGSNVKADTKSADNDEKSVGDVGCVNSTSNDNKVNNSLKKNKSKNKTCFWFDGSINGVVWLGCRDAPTSFLWNLPSTPIYIYVVSNNFSPGVV